MTVTDLTTDESPRERNSHIWPAEQHEHYVESRWVWRRFFQAEPVVGVVEDPCCGFGRVVEAAHAAGLAATGWDLIDRGMPGLSGIRDFLKSDMQADNRMFNPPFSLGREFALHALKLTRFKVAMIFPVRRLAAAGAWIEKTPHYRTLYLTPRPSMPPGELARAYEAKGKEPSGGKQDFCILVWLKGFDGRPTEGWLRRDA